MFPQVQKNLEDANWPSKIITNTLLSIISCQKVDTNYDKIDVTLIGSREMLSNMP